ncbi:MAG: universal stress protein [Bacteroidetes bacterium]|nr:universal stress protein [Bacteroidota bacterium]
MKNILIPVDFSDYTWTQVQYALDFTKHFACEIRLVHVFDDPFVDKDISQTPIKNQVTGYTEELIHKMETDAHSNMQVMLAKVREATKDRKDSDFILSSSVRRGFAADEVLNEARAWRPHLIIMGTRGHSKIDRVMFGTVTQSVIKHAHIPILALPLNYSFRKISKVLYGTNFNNYDVYAIGKMMHLLQDSECKFHITHFNLDDDIVSDEKNMMQLSSQVENDYRNARLQFEIINSEKLKKGFEEFIADYSIDMVALTARKMNMWQNLFTKSNTIMLLNATDIPLLVFHEV